MNNFNFHFSAAENAIQDLSNNNMLNISASFAKKRVRSENHQEMRFDQTPQDRPNEKRIDWNRRYVIKIMIENFFAIISMS